MPYSHELAHFILSRITQFRFPWDLMSKNVCLKIWMKGHFNSNHSIRVPKLAKKKKKDNGGKQRVCFSQFLKMMTKRAVLGIKEGVIFFFWTQTEGRTSVGMYCFPLAVSDTHSYSKSIY